MLTYIFQSGSIKLKSLNLDSEPFTVKWHANPFYKFSDKNSLFLFLTLINTAPFGTLNTPGVVPVMLHTLRMPE